MKPFLFPCPACASQMSSTAKACPHCGHVEAKSRTAAIIFWITLVVVVGAIWWIDSSDKSRKEWRHQNEKVDQSMEDFRRKNIGLAP